MVRKNSIYSALMFGWILLVFGGVVAVISGVAHPLISPSELPENGVVLFGAGIVLAALGGLVVSDRSGTRRAHAPGTGGTPELYDGVLERAATDEE